LKRQIYPCDEEMGAVWELWVEAEQVVGELG